jgi:Kef-type K+ transport system membrane component KefB
MSVNEAFLLFVMAFTAFISPYISQKLYLPTPVAEILFGIIIGSVIQIDTHAFSIIQFLSEFGFLVLMYLAGLEIDIEDLKKTPKKDFIIYFIYYIIIICLAILIAYFFNISISIMMIACMTAIGLLFPILSANNTIDTPIGKTLLIIGSIGEIISLVIITVITIYYRYGIGFKSLNHFAQIVGFCLFAFIFLKTLKLFSWWYPNVTLKMVSSNNTAETGMRTNFLNMLLFVALASFLNIEIIIGSFIGGILYSTILKEKEDIREAFEMFGNGFLIPVFFIYVGLSFNISSLTDLNIIFVALILTFAILLIRVIASIVFLFSDIGINSILLIPVGTSFPLTLLVAFAEVGRSANILSAEMVNATILTSILSAILYPPIFRFLFKFVK